MNITRLIHRLARRGSTLVLLLLVAVVATACPGVGDPATDSRIINDTSAPVEVVADLDTTQWRFGFEPDEYQEWLSERSDEWIQAELETYLEASEGVELVAVEPDRFAGTFSIAPGGVLWVDSSLGSGPNVRFSRMAVTKNGETTSYVGEDQVLALFDEIDEGQFEYRITDG